MIKTKLQQIKRANGSLVHSVNIPLELIGRIGWEKGEKLTVEVEPADYGIHKIIIFKEEDMKKTGIKDISNYKGPPVGNVPKAVKKEPVKQEGCKMGKELIQEEIVEETVDEDLIRIKERLIPGLEFACKHELTRKETEILIHFLEGPRTRLKLAEELKMKPSTLHHTIMRLKLKRLLVLKKRDSIGNNLYEFNKKTDEADI